MRLRLLNGYPFPFPTKLPLQDQEDISEAAASKSMELRGVLHFEWLHTLTVEFRSWGACNDAANRTGWKPYSYLVLEATTSPGDGYDHPAIVVGNTAYCGFVLEQEN